MTKDNSALMIGGGLLLLLWAMSKRPRGITYTPSNSADTVYTPEGQAVRYMQTPGGAVASGQTISSAPSRQLSTNDMLKLGGLRIVGGLFDKIASNIGRPSTPSTPSPENFVPAYQSPIDLNTIDAGGFTPTPSHDPYDQATSSSDWVDMGFY